MPVITLLTGKIDFSNLFIALDGGSYKTLVSEKVIWILTTLFHRNMVEEIPY